MAEDSSSGLGMLLSFLAQNSQSGAPQLPQMQIPNINPSMPSMGGMPQAGQNGGLGHAILSNFLSHYVTKKTKDYEESETAKTIVKDYNNMLQPVIESTSNPTRKVQLQTMQNLINSKNPTLQSLGIKSIENIIRESQQDLNRTTSQKDIEGGGLPAQIRTRQALGLPTGGILNDEGQLVGLPTPTGDYFNDKRINAIQQKAMPPGVNPDTLSISKANLDLARNRDDRAEDREARKERIDQIKMAQEEFRNQTSQWKLENPTYLTDQKEIQESEADHKRLVASVENYKKVLEKFDEVDRHNPLLNGQLQTAYQNVTWGARSKRMQNTGVMNVGEYPMLNATVQDPTKFTPGGFRTKAELIKQLDEFVNISKLGNEALKAARAPKSPPPQLEAIIPEDAINRGGEVIKNFSLGPKAAKLSPEKQRQILNVINSGNEEDIMEGLKRGYISGGQ